MGGGSEAEKRGKEEKAGKKGSSESEEDIRSEFFNDVPASASFRDKGWAGSSRKCTGLRI